MPASGKSERGDRYHHGDLRAALVEAAIELIGEGGVRGFSMAEASRRLGVAVSAPYAHFADRDDLLAAVAVRACDVFYAELRRETSRLPDPAERLAGMARCYVRFAGAHRALFEVLTGPVIDKRGHPEVEAAEKQLDDAFLDCVRALTGDGPGAAGGTAPATDRAGDPAAAGDPADDLATAVEATAYGHARFLIDGSFGEGDQAVEQAADRAAAATLALIAGRRLLSRRADGRTARS
jgi:AcrR family transcriptional regulator